jgi:hypothetical protein
VGNGLESQTVGTPNDLPLLPLAVALPRMLEDIEAAPIDAGPGERCRLRQRAELIRELLTPTKSPAPA